jgi:hypothetical protein
LKEAIRYKLRCAVAETESSNENYVMVVEWPNGKGYDITIDDDDVQTISVDREMATALLTALKDIHGGSG